MPKLAAPGTSNHTAGTIYRRPLRGPRENLTRTSAGSNSFSGWLLLRLLEPELFKAVLKRSE